MSAIADTQAKKTSRLRPGDLNDIDGYHTLAGNPLIYQYLFNGVPPDKEYITRLLTQSVANAEETGFGMWFLDDVSTRYAGCVELPPYPFGRSAELIYLLDPRYWGQGLALRTAWAAITHAFLSLQIASVIAGTDLPNTASLAVMRRLGPRFHKDVHYPLGDGVEYVIRRDDIGPLPKPALIPIETDSEQTKERRR